MANINFKFGTRACIINYDLENNDVSAEEIARESNDQLFTSITMKNKKSYHLPNTTLYCTLDKTTAQTTFINAFNKTKSTSKISRLFITEVNEQSAYIQDEN